MSKIGTSTPYILAAGRLAPLRCQIARIAAARIVVGVLVEDQRHARLPLVLGAELPAAEDGGERRVPVVPHLCPGPNGNSATLARVMRWGRSTGPRGFRDLPRD